MGRGNLPPSDQLLGMDPSQYVETGVEPAAPGRSLLPGAFVRAVAAEVVKRIGKASPPLNTEVRSRLAKFWYGPDPSVHYELWLHENTAQLEIGLHAESAAERNRAIYAALDRCMVEIQSELGASMWLEEWDRGWVRLYETQRLWPLDPSRVEEVASRVCEVMAVVQPIYVATCEPTVPGA